VIKLEASNEGLRSMNEQLQSRSKELEIANAELRSVNQDLQSAEGRQRALVEQLNHRVGNILTVIGAMANQTLARTDSPDHFAAAFLGRLNSMSRFHALLARENWGEVSLSDILMSELQTHAGERDGRVKLGGPGIAFVPSKALALGLVFHELTSNAVRHGALAKPEGRVSVTWNTDRGGLTITWLERNGAKVAKPTHKGFGTELIEGELKSALGAEVIFDYAAPGIEVQIAIPHAACR
jgi:two-component system, chemotaxis family, CheB/CheR fusion protein